MKIIQKPILFYDERTTPIDMIVFHCNIFTPDKFIEILNENKLSCHYIIDTDGTLIQCVSENKRARHAGIGYWRGIDTDINSHSIGIELISPTLGQTPYTPVQIKTLIELTHDLMKRYHIPQTNIIGHSDMAPTRKPDPGKAFPWAELALNGIGLYPTTTEKQIKTTDIKKMLAQIGYDTRTDETAIASAYAFQRRFMPYIVRTRQNIRSLILHPIPRTRTNFPKQKLFIQLLQTVAKIYQSKT